MCYINAYSILNCVLSFVVQWSVFYWLDWFIPIGATRWTNQGTHSPNREESLPALSPGIDTGASHSFFIEFFTKILIVISLFLLNIVFWVC